MKKLLFIGIVLGLSSGIMTSDVEARTFFEPVLGLKEDLSKKGIDAELVYTGEFWANVQGGIKRETTYMDNLDFIVNVDTEKAGLWSGGRFYVSLLSNGGHDRLTGEIVGDLQTASNIEAPRTTRLYEIWYAHQINGVVSLLLGIHDYNSEFNVTEYGSLFINSSFGIQPDISTAGRPSIFPLAAPGARLKLSPNDSWEILFGVYDGDPGDSEISEHYPRSDFDSDGGAFFAAETAYHFGEELPGFVKFGMWFNSGEFADLVDTDSTGAAIMRDENYGGYVVIDKMLYKEKDEQGLGAFLQIGGAPDHLNEINFYLGTGFTYKGLFPNRDKDELGVAMAFASISDELTAGGSRDDEETVLEFTYKAHICDNFAVQPNVQWIFDPSGEPTRDDAVVVGTRFEISI